MKVDITNIKKITKQSVVSLYFPKITYLFQKSSKRVK